MKTKFSYKTVFNGCQLKAFQLLIPQLIGGSADLSGSNNTKTKNSKLLIQKILMGIIFIMELESMVCLLL